MSTLTDFFSSKSSSKRIGLALGGGATKGFLHIGVLRYLEENDYIIEEIAGTSMGALIGSLIALGRNSDQIESFFDGMTNNDVVDFNRSTLTLKGQKITQKIEEVFGQTCFEDLKIPFKTVVTDLNSGEEIIFSSGPLIDALRYTISVPGIFALYDEKKPYVDGGIVNNLPINHLNHENIIAVSCRGYGGFEMEKNGSFWGFTIPETSLGFNTRVLVRSFLIMMRRIEDMQLIQYPRAVLIRPNTTDLSATDVTVLHQAINLGYDAATKTLSSHTI